MPQPSRENQFHANATDGSINAARRAFSLAPRFLAKLAIFAACTAPILAADPQPNLKPLPADIAALIAANKPLTPEQSLVAMRTEPGLRVELAAAEPLTGDPVAIAFDERGRMFVAEDRGYPIGPAAGGAPMGIIAMLEDTDGDGVYDKRTEFAIGLTYPNGLMCWRGGLIVTCAPEIYYLKDTDGHGKADVKKILLTGFMTNSTTQIRVAHPTLGRDGWIYLTSGLTGGKVTCPDHPERKVVEFKLSDSRFRPDTLEFETVAGAAQFGECFDDFGRKFTVDNRHPLSMVVFEPRYLWRNPYLAFSETVAEVGPGGELGKVFPLAKDQTTAGMIPVLMDAPHAGTFTSACGIRIYGGDALPPEFYGNSFTCEPAQALMQRQVISPNGAVFKSRVGRPGTEVMVSADNWFRPVFAQNAPDGSLCVASMYRKFIDHPEYVPAEMRGKLDFISGRNQGRIYRLVAESWKNQPKPFDLGSVNTTGLVAHLANPKVWWRETAFRLLLERADPAALPALKSLAHSSSLPQARVLALRLLNDFGALETAQIIGALGDQYPAVRENALQLAEPRLAQSAELAAKVKTLADDADARVRFQAMLTLGALNETEIIPTLARVAVRDAGDKWTRAAALSSVGKHSREFLDEVLSQPGNPDGLADLLAETCRVVGSSGAPETLAGVLARITSAGSLGYACQSAAVTGLGEALRPRELSLTEITSVNAADALRARDGLARLIQNALQLAGDDTRPVRERQAATGLLAFSDFATAGKPLQALLSPQQPEDMQMAAVKALLRVSEPDAEKILLEPARWKSFSPPLRELVLGSLLWGHSGAEALLAAIAAGAIAPTEIDPARRKQLIKHHDPVIAANAEKLFKGLEGGDRMKVYEDYKPVLALKANLANGHAVFTRTCVPCHAVNGEGAKVGPDLTGIRNQPAEALLLHILVPSYEIAAGFNAYEIETKDGRMATGLLASETPASVTLRRALGQEETILRSNIASMTIGTLSLMPDELEKTMSRQDLRDLIGFLKGE